MEFRIADTFTDSFLRLTGDEQKQVKTTAFDLQLNPASPGMNFHKLDRAKDKHFWSVRVGSDMRLLVHGLGLAQQRHLAPVQETEVGAHRGEGYQSPGG